MIFTTDLPGPDWADSRTEDQHQRQWGEPEQTGEDSTGEHPLNKTSVSGSGSPFPISHHSLSVNLSVRGVGAWLPLPLTPNLPPNNVCQPTTLKLATI
jgi:hypothetical protein